MPPGEQRRSSSGEQMCTAEDNYSYEDQNMCVARPDQQSAVGNLVVTIIQDLYRQNPGLEGRELVRAAWRDAVTLRNRHGQDLNLAAAEHFLYSCGETEGLGSGL